MHGTGSTARHEQGVAHIPVLFQSVLSTNFSIATSSTDEIMIFETVCASEVGNSFELFSGKNPGNPLEFVRT